MPAEVVVIGAGGKRSHSTGMPKTANNCEQFHPDDTAQPGEPAGFSKLAAPLMTIAIRHANRKDLRSLRGILETA